MKRIKSFIGYSQGLTIGQIIPDEWIGDHVGHRWWVTPSGPSEVYGWCELEELSCPEGTIAATLQRSSSSIAPLVAAAEQLGPRALALLQSIADRLVKGAKEHGDFAAPKELRREALEEHLDAVVYLALELQQPAPEALSAPDFTRLASHIQWLEDRGFAATARDLRETYKVRRG